MSTLELFAFQTSSRMGLHSTGSIHWPRRTISDKAFPGKLTTHQTEASWNRQTLFSESRTLGIQALDPAGDEA